MTKLTAAACRAGRALLGWGVRDLAAHAGVGVMSVFRFEAGEPVRADTIGKLMEAFTVAGVEITNGTGTGARLLNDRPRAAPAKSKAAPKAKAKKAKRK